jgi:hypothetical protein
MTLKTHQNSKSSQTCRASRSLASRSSGFLIVLALRSISLACNKKAQGTYWKLNKREMCRVCCDCLLGQYSNRLQAKWLRHWDSISGRARDLYLLQSVRTCSAARPTSYAMATGCCSPALKWLGHETDCSSPRRDKLTI